MTHAETLTAFSHYLQPKIAVSIQGIYRYVAPPCILLTASKLGNQLIRI